MILKGSRLTIFLIFYLVEVGVFGCAGGGGPVEPGQDTTPPVWDDTVGIVSVVPGDTTVTVNFGTATDTESPPVEYLVFSDTDDDPFDKTPVIVTTNDPYVVDNLVNGTEYWFGVRCRDSADPPNTESNTVTISATPHEGPDITPPVWDDTVGVVSVVKGDSIVTVNFGTATDEESPPVEYLIFNDTDDDPFDQIPVVVTANTPYVFVNLVDGTEYWFGVRCRDSASTPNVDDNVVVMSATPSIGWAVTWGTEPNVQAGGKAVDVDETGNIYVTGYILGTTDLDPGPATAWYSSNGDSDVFLSKFDPSGSLLWAWSWGGISGDYGHGVAIDHDQNVFVTGNFQAEVDFDPGPGSDIHSTGDLHNKNIFLSKYNSVGEYQWTETWSASMGDRCKGIAEDSTGNIYVAWNANWPILDPPYEGVRGFLRKISASGEFEWEEDWGLNGVWDVSIDNANHVYLGGYSEYDITIRKLKTGSATIWSKTWMTTDLTLPGGIAVDDLGHVYIDGFFQGTQDFDPGPGEDWHTSNGPYDAFLTKFDDMGNHMWTLTWGGVLSDEVVDIAFDNMGYVLVSGIFGGTVDFDPGPGIEILDSSSGHVFLSKFNLSGELQWARNWQGSSLSLSTAVDSNSNVFSTGAFIGLADFNPGPGIDYHYSDGWGGYLAKTPPDGNWW